MWILLNIRYILFYRLLNEFLFFSLHCIVLLQVVQRRKRATNSIAAEWTNINGVGWIIENYKGLLSFPIDKHTHTQMLNYFANNLIKFSSTHEELGSNFKYFTFRLLYALRFYVRHGAWTFQRNPLSHTRFTLCENALFILHNARIILSIFIFFLCHFKWKYSS